MGSRRRRFGHNIASLPLQTGGLGLRSACGMAPHGTASRQSRHCTGHWLGRLAWMLDVKAGRRPPLLCLVSGRTAGNTMRRTVCAPFQGYPCWPSLVPVAKARSTLTLFFFVKLSTSFPLDLCFRPMQRGRASHFTLPEASHECGSVLDRVRKRRADCVHTGIFAHQSTRTSEDPRACQEADQLCAGDTKRRDVSVAVHADERPVGRRHHAALSRSVPRCHC